MSETVMIVTGESSGELYGSLLADSLKKKIPGIRITGIGGERMKTAGVELIAGISGSFGLTEALSSIKALKAAFNKATRALREDRPRVLVLIDYPEFNLRLAAEAKKENIRVLYYVSPQVWAWRRRRIKKIAGLVDRMAVVLPFEERLYKDTGLDCEFVGHPVFDEIKEMGTDRRAIKKELGLKEDKPLLSILPGSRRNELERLLPVTADIIRECQKEFRDFQFCVPFSPNTDLLKYQGEVDGLRRMGVMINKGESLKTLAASDYAVIASGTASFQAVLLGVPVVVIYRLFPLTYWLAKLIVKVKYISLVNILAGEEVAKEFLQGDANPVNIIREIRKLMTDTSYREKMFGSYKRVREMFAGKKASDRVADLVLGMAGWKQD